MTPPPPSMPEPLGAPLVGIILSTLNSDDIIYEGSVGQFTEVKSNS